MVEGKEYSTDELPDHSLQRVAAARSAALLYDWSLGMVHPVLVQSAARRACFLVSGKVASLTRSVSRMMAKPYEYGTCSASKRLSRT